jgi:hypothetical protein
MCTVGDLSSVRNVAVRYFKSIHLWFPIVSEITYHERISKIYETPSAEYSLLSLSMALITALPPEKETSDRFTTLYMLVKSAIAMAEAANVHSLETVQSRLLVSLFEFGHAIEPAAFISLAATARAAVAIELNKEINKPCMDNLGPCSKREEGNRVWWGIVMLDRYVLQLLSLIGSLTYGMTGIVHSSGVKGLVQHMIWKHLAIYLEITIYGTKRCV